MLWGIMTAPMMATAGCNVLAVTLGTMSPATPDTNMRLLTCSAAVQVHPGSYMAVPDTHVTCSLDRTLACRREGLQHLSLCWERRPVPALP